MRFAHAPQKRQVEVRVIATPKSDEPQKKWNTSNACRPSGECGNRNLTSNLPWIWSMLIWMSSMWPNHSWL
jgi:hypothetical protein